MPDMPDLVALALVLAEAKGMFYGLADFVRAAAGTARPAKDLVSTTRREGPPLAEWRFRHLETGEVALMRVSIVDPPGGPFHSIEVARPDGSRVEGIMRTTWQKGVDLAREIWREKERELVAAGYERIVDEVDRPGR